MITTVHLMHSSRCIALPIPVGSIPPVEVDTSRQISEIPSGRTCSRITQTQTAVRYLIGKSMTLFKSSARTWQLAYQLLRARLLDSWSYTAHTD